jgi:hypothetical protein
VQPPRGLQSGKGTLDLSTEFNTALSCVHLYARTRGGFCLIWSGTFLFGIGTCSLCGEGCGGGDGNCGRGGGRVFGAVCLPDVEPCLGSVLRCIIAVVSCVIVAVITIVIVIVIVIIVTAVVVVVVVVIVVVIVVVVVAWRVSAGVVVARRVGGGAVV